MERRRSFGAIAVRGADYTASLETHEHLTRVSENFLPVGQNSLLMV